MLKHMYNSFPMSLSLLTCAICQMCWVIRFEMFSIDINFFHRKKGCGLFLRAQLGSTSHVKCPNLTGFRLFFYFKFRGSWQHVVCAAMVPLGLLSNCVYMVSKWKDTEDNFFSRFCGELSRTWSVGLFCVQLGCCYYFGFLSFILNLIVYLIFRLILILLSGFNKWLCFICLHYKQTTHAFICGK